MDVREFLMELYLLHGEREFDYIGGTSEFIMWANTYSMNQKLTPKALEYLKNE